MNRTRFKSFWLLMAVAGLVFAWTAQAVAQTSDASETSGDEATQLESPEELADAANPPRHIVELLDSSDLTQERLDAMRAEGMGWGEIRIAVRLAEQIAAASETPLSFDDALDGVLDKYEAGEGFGEIAKENNLKVGELIGNGNQKRGTDPGDGLGSHQGMQAGETKRATARKRGLLARLGNLVGFGKKERLNQNLEPADGEAAGKVEKVQKAEKIQKTEKVAKLDRPERPSRPERPDRPEKPVKPEKPERPERGPNR